MKLGEAMYAASQAANADGGDAGPGAPGAGGPGPNAKKDDVVDADFTEVKKDDQQKKSA